MGVITILSSSFGFLSFSRNSSLTFGLISGTLSNNDPCSSSLGSSFFLLFGFSSGAAATLICTLGFRSALLNFFFGSGLISSSSSDSSSSSGVGKAKGVITIFSSSFGFLSFSRNSSLTFGLISGTLSNNDPCSSSLGSFFFLLLGISSGAAATLICTLGFR